MAQLCSPVSLSPGGIDETVTEDMELEIDCVEELSDSVGPVLYSELEKID